MVSIIGSKIREIYDELKANNKITSLSDDEVRQIDIEIDEAMSEFRQEFSRKEEQSKSDTSKVILNF